jgi:hypothetical protein
MPNASVRSASVSLAEALSKGPPVGGNLAVSIFAHGSLERSILTPSTHEGQSVPNCTIVRSSEIKDHGHSADDAEINIL